MNTPSVSEAVQGIATFERLDDDNVWYSVKYGDGAWQFPVPRHEAIGGIFHKEERALYLMRWIRRWIAVLDSRGHEPDALDIP